MVRMLLCKVQILAHAFRSKPLTGPTGRQSRKGTPLIRVSGYAPVDGFDVSQNSIGYKNECSRIMRTQFL